MTRALAAEVRFIRVRAGRVHVQTDAADGEEYSPVTADAVIDLMVGATHVMCGRRLRQHIGGQQQSAWPTDRFDDEDLCRRCVASVPEADRWRLFEHAERGEPHV